LERQREGNEYQNEYQSDVFFAMVVASRSGIFISCLAASVPVLLCVLYIFTLRPGKQ